MGRTRKKYGGAFTANQLFELFQAEYENREIKQSIKLDILAKDDTDLYNSTVRVYFDPLKARFIMVHRGTQLDNLFDWTNNVRNIIAVKTKMLRTKRAERAETGHKRLKEYLIQLYHRSNPSTTNEQIIIREIAKLKQVSDSQLLRISTEDAVDELLKNKLSTIGHSQGAVYAYTYGNQGKETIVFNPAPYIGKKPDNIYIVRVKGDPVSSITTSGNSFFSLSPSKIQVLERRKLDENDKGLITPHFITQLRGNATIVGNKQIFTHDTQIKGRSNSSDKKRHKSQGGSKRKTQKNRYNIYNG